MTIATIATAFSNGEFEKTYPFISDNAVWTVIEENSFTGKHAIIENCEQVSRYFKSVTTRFNMLNVIADGNKIAINGTAEFLKDNKRVAYVSACDVYEFNQQGQIEIIQSYCIQSR